jgi:hypothetical protein
MSTMHTTTGLKPYVSKGTPNIGEDRDVYLNREFKKIQSSLNAAITAMQALEARIVAGGL